jgi:hypothetical protein
MSSLIVETRALGRRKQLLDRWSVPVPPPGGEDGDGGLTLRELIAGIVRAEVAAFAERQRARRFVHVLSSREIVDGAARGKIDSDGNAADADVDADDAVDAALAGFEDGVYLVVLDGEEQKHLCSGSAGLCRRPQSARVPAVDVSCRSLKHNATTSSLLPSYFDNHLLRSPSAWINALRRKNWRHAATGVASSLG